MCSAIRQRPAVLAVGAFIFEFSPFSLFLGKRGNKKIYGKVMEF